MKTFLKILVLFFLAFQFIGCDKEDVIVKTPGEINGELIMKLVNSNEAPAQCYITQPQFNDPYFFEVEGQFLKLKNMNIPGYFLVFDLNNLSYFEITNNYFWFKFNGSL